MPRTFQSEQPSGPMTGPMTGPMSEHATEKPQVRRRRGRTEPEVPLGSLTQREHQTDAVCLQCGSNRITRLVLNLTDGTPVSFTSCHRCEYRTWDHDGTALSVETVLDRTRKE